MNDLRYAFRILGKNPGFTAVAVLTLALGISANTTIFSLISALFFQPLPVQEPERLVVVLQKSDVWKFPHGHSWKDYEDYRDRVEAFSDAIAYMLNPVHLSADRGAAERTWIEVVSGNYFSMLGVQPALGRFFRPEEGRNIGGEPFVVLGHDYWVRRFAADPGIVGRVIHLNGHPFTVIGVASQAFHSAEWAMAPSAFVLASMVGRLRPGMEDVLNNRGFVAFKVMGRLKPGVTLGQARAAVTVVAKQLATDYPKEHKQARVLVVPERHCRPEPTFSELLPLVSSVFMVMVALVLLIACANVANLMFSRALIRQKEMGIRTAIGASRLRLIRQLLVESVLLAVLAGGVGFVIARWCGELLSRYSPQGDIPVNTAHAWDWRITVFTFLISVAAGIVTGLVPALRATRLDLHTALKEGGATLLTSGRHPFRSLLVVSQVAICVVVLIAGGLFVQTLRNVARLDLGFRPENLLIASLDLGLQGYDADRIQQFETQLLEKARALPGVQAASVAANVPFYYMIEIASVGIEGRITDRDDSFSPIHYNRVDPDYLNTLRIPLLRGRNLSSRDDANSPPVALINTLMADRFWPGQDALGKRFQKERGGPMLEVVGIVPTGRYVMVGEEPRPYFYVPIRQHDTSSITLHVRTAGHPESILPALRKAIGELDPHLPVFNARSMEDHLRESAFALMPLRMGATLAGVQGALGLLLAVMGLYGVVSYVVNQRTREVGIRVALGAQKADILRLVVRDGLRLTLIGMALGLAGAFLVVQVVRKVLYGLSPATAPIFLAVVVGLGGVALLACYLPARRAMRVDPMEALRCE